MGGRRVLLRVTVIGAIVAAAAVVGPAWYVKTVTDDRIMSVEDVPAAAGGVRARCGDVLDGQPSRYLGARLDVAYQLFTAGKVKAILVRATTVRSTTARPTACGTTRSSGAFRPGS